MNRYETPIPRVALGIAAVGMTALTVGVSVVLPAKIYADSHERIVLAASKAATPASTDGVTASARIDAIAVRGQGLSTAPCASSKPNGGPEG
jgi:hypothetical protein